MIVGAANELNDAAELVDRAQILWSWLSSIGSRGASISTGGNSRGSDGTKVRRIACEASAMKDRPICPIISATLVVRRSLASTMSGCDGHERSTSIRHRVGRLSNLQTHAHGKASFARSNGEEEVVSRGGPRAGRDAAVALLGGRPGNSDRTALGPGARSVSRTRTRAASRRRPWFWRRGALRLHQLHGVAPPLGLGLEAAAAGGDDRAVDLAAEQEHRGEPVDED